MRARANLWSINYNYHIRYSILYWFTINWKAQAEKDSQAEKTVSETVDEPEQPIDEALPEEIDDFSIEFAEDNALEVIEILDDDEIDDEIIDIDDSSASGRLASLRDEIMTDEQPRDTRPLSDRMADFFKD